MNLQANIAAGRGNTFAYFGPGTGTAPLPTYLAYFNAQPNAQAGDASKYTGSNWTNTTFLGRLAAQSPRPDLAAGTDLQGDATRRANAILAGLPANFFLLNPDVNSANVYKSNATTKYNALQIDVRRRMSHGLQLSANYQYAVGYNSLLLGQRYGRILQLNTGVPRNALKMSWDFAVPVGRGQRFGTHVNRWLDAVIGGWEFHGDGRMQNRLLDFGNVRLVGMTLDELRNAYKIRFATDPATGVKTVWILPQDIIDNTIKAFNTSPTSSTGYSALGVPEGRYLAPANGPGCIQLKTGDCAPVQQTVMSPIFTRFDMSLVKKFAIKGRTGFEMRLDVMNVFNNINFNPYAPTNTTTAFSAATFSQITAAYTDASNTFDPGGRLGQLGFRFSW